MSTSRRLIPLLLLATMTLGAGLSALAGASARPTSPTILGPEGVALSFAPDLAPAGTPAGRGTVDGIKCVTLGHEVVHYHTHTYLSVVVNGSMRRLPPGLGITAPRLVENFSSAPFYDLGIGNCLYWIHVHTNDNIVHVEAPQRERFTLGQLFDIWGQPLSATQVGPAVGPVTVYVDGQIVPGNPRDVLLLDLQTVQLDVGTRAPFVPHHFSVSGLCGAGTNTCTGTTTTTVAG